jgi:RNA polymerase sigma factor (sigma-70 family)
MGQLAGVLRQVKRVVAPPDGEGLCDARLLERYLSNRDEAAFEALLRRHGPMVLGVCRRVLRHEQDAEDAFQATFLVLACRADTVRPRHLVGNWLHGVARRTALAARRAAARRCARENRAGAARQAVSAAEEGGELRALVDAEVARLPERYRAAVVLCDLEGRPRREAARLLGWGEGTLSGRLARARALLARRLAGRGVGPAAAVVPMALAASTLRAATLVGAGIAVGAGLDPRAVSLAKGVMRMMWAVKIKQAVALVLTLGMLGLGVGAALVADEAPPPPKSAPAEKGPQQAGKRPAEAQLPSGAAPYQVLARVDKGGRLVVRSCTNYSEPYTTIPPGGKPPITSYRHVQRVETRRYDEGFKAHDTHGKPIDAKTLARRLKNETPALASADGKPVDKLHLRLIKDGTIVLILPIPRVVVYPTAPPIPAFPAPPAPPPGRPGGAAPPAGPLPPVQTLPALPPPPPAVPVPPPPEGDGR